MGTSATPTPAKVGGQTAPRPLQQQANVLQRASQLDEVEAAISRLTGQVGSLGTRLDMHMSLVQGSEPPATGPVGSGVGLSNGGPPPFKLAALHMSLQTLEGAVKYLEQQVQRVEKL